jgi:hypothetical protein
MIKRICLFSGLGLIITVPTALFIQFAGDLDRASFGSHPLPAPAQMLLLSLLLAPALGMLVVFSVRLQSSQTALPKKTLEARELVSWSPLLFLWLLPLMNAFFLDAADFRARLNHLGWAVLAATLFLKAASWLTLTGWRGPSRVIQAFKDWNPRKKLAVLFLLALLGINGCSLILTGGGITFAGDEPHYLIITHSLLNDGDFDLKNNYAAQDYQAYMDTPAGIASHTAPGTDGRLSFHSPGVSLLLFPFYALGSQLGGNGLILLLRLGMSLFAALLGLQVYLYVLQAWRREGTALWIWFLTSFTAPILFYGLHVYGELVVAVIGLTVFRLLRFRRSFKTWELAALGLVLGTMIWFHAIKYLLLMAPLLLYGLLVLCKRPGPRSRALWFSGAFLLSLGLYFGFQTLVYGTASLFAVSWRGGLSGGESLSYTGEVFFGIPFRYRWETLAGYFLDQRDGLLPYAPIYLFAFLGLVDMLRRRSREPFLLLLIGLPFIGLQAFLTQRTGYAPQARPLVGAIWVLIIPMAYFWIHNARKFFTWLFSAASAFSLFAALSLLLNPRALYQLTTFGETNRSGSLFLHFSNLHCDITRFLPSFIKLEENRWLPNWIWMAGLALLILLYWLAPRHEWKTRFGHYAAGGLAGLALFSSLMVLFPRPVLRSPVNTAYPSGEKVVFYSLGRVARMPEPGRFLLPEADRDYVFYFTSWREISRLRLRFGSEEGEYSVVLRTFDDIIFRGKTTEEYKTEEIAVQGYPLKGKHLYRITITLTKNAGLPPHLSPYRLDIIPLSR